MRFLDNSDNSIPGRDSVFPTGPQGEQLKRRNLDCGLMALFLSASVACAGFALSGCPFSTSGVEFEEDDSGTDAEPADAGGKDADSPDSEAGKDAEPPDSGDAGDAAVEADADAEAPDAGPSWPTCKGGDTGTVSKITSLGANVYTLLWTSDGTETDVVGTTSTDTDLTGKTMPALAVIDGQGGTVGFSITGAGGSSTPQVWYLINLATLPPASCGGGAKTLACRSAIAHSFRCQFAPFSESVGCPPPVTFSAKPAASSFSVGSAELAFVVTSACP